MKITIVDDEVSPLPREVERVVWQGVMDAKDRLGESGSLIEVIRIARINATPCIEVKLVFDSTIGVDSGVSQILSAFNFDYKEHETNLAEALSNKIVRAFQFRLAKQVQLIEQRKEKLSIVLAELGMKERVSGNDIRCGDCGRKLEKISGPSKFECPHCRLKNPDCPKCGQITTQYGLIFKCFNCGEEVGTGT